MVFQERRASRPSHLSAIEDEEEESDPKRSGEEEKEEEESGVEGQKGRRRKGDEEEEEVEGREGEHRRENEKNGHFEAPEKEKASPRHPVAFSREEQKNRLHNVSVPVSRPLCLSPLSLPLSSSPTLFECIVALFCSLLFSLPLVFFFPSPYFLFLSLSLLLSSSYLFFFLFFDTTDTHPLSILSFSLSFFLPFSHDDNNSRGLTCPLPRRRERAERATRLSPALSASPLRRRRSRWRRFSERRRTGENR